MESNTMKRSLQHLSSSKVTERIQAINDLKSSMIQQGVPELKTVLRGMLMILPLYVDRQSVRIAKEFFTFLAEHYKEQLLILLSSAMHELVVKFQFNNPNLDARGHAVSVFRLLSWSCIVVEHVSSTDGAVIGDKLWENIVNSQCPLLATVHAFPRPAIKLAAEKKIFHLWHKVQGSEMKYCQTLVAAEPSAYTLAMMGLLLKFMQEKKMNTPPGVLEKFSENFSKSILSTKVPIKPFIVESSKSLLLFIEREKFMNDFIPIIEKALLRNPEIIMPVLWQVLSYISIDLSSCSLRICKQISGQLVSKDVNCRSSAALVAAHLAVQCSDGDAVLSVCKFLFSSISGAKIQTDQRLAVLATTGAFSCSPVGSPHNLTAEIIELFISYLQQEGHETTLLGCISALQKWVSNFSHTVPDKLVQWYASLLSSKLSSTVRSAYLCCMVETFKGDCAASGVSLIPLVVNVVEKSQSNSQANECLSASLLLLKLTSFDMEFESILASFWKLFATKIQTLFVTEKFLDSASPSVVCNAVSFVEYLLLDPTDRLPSQYAQMLHSAFIAGLLHAEYSVRKHSFKCLKHLVASLSGAEISLLLVRAFAKYKTTGEIGVAREEKALMKMTNVPNLSRESAHDICFEALNASHRPGLSSCRIWKKIAQQLSVDPGQILRERGSKIANEISKLSQPDKRAFNKMITICRIEPFDGMMPRVVEFVCRLIQDPQLQGICTTDVAVMLTPDGVLYDKSIIKGAGQSTSTANMKRENKLYSYAEQMAEMELRKELEKKKPKKNEPVLSKKQQELVQETLLKESARRKLCLHLNDCLHLACEIINACVEGEPRALSPYLLRLLRIWRPLLKNPLASGHAVRVWCCLSQPHLPMYTCFATLRVIGPTSSLDKAWTAEGINRQTKRSLDYLQLSPHAEKFCLAFPLLEGCLKGSKHVKQVLDIIVKNSAWPQEQFPRREVVMCLLDFLEDSSGSDLQEAVKAVIECCAKADNVAQVESLLVGLQSSNASVRGAALKGLKELPRSFLLNLNGIEKRIAIARCDSDDVNRELSNSLDVDVDGSELCLILVQETVHPCECVRFAAGRALARQVEVHPVKLLECLQALQDLYQEKLYVPPPAVDEFGRPIAEASIDECDARIGIGLALQQLAPLVSGHLIPLFEFYVHKGFLDRNLSVMKCMLDGAIATVQEHGKGCTNEILPLLDNFLSSAPDSDTYDQARQSAVVVMGLLAKYLDSSDPRVKPIIGKLIESLSTKSQSVQESVANCLAPLVPAVKDDAPDMVRKLLNHLFESNSYSERRGAAYGLAGFIKGLGILSLKQLGVMESLETAVQDKKIARHRESALFAFEMLCLMLGRLFEPYVVHILPHLLLCFGDLSQFVREAAEECAKAVMSKLSAHGVKLILPSLLKALEEDSWRTKTGSVELLGSMAYCAPKQLSACLPSIVPKLVEILTDSHHKVQEAGYQAIRHIGQVIKNPEIQAIVDHLIGALQDPTTCTTPCLHLLLRMRFVHFIDAPSLALIMPVVERAFEDRSTETRKMAGQIIGNMYSLTDQKDLVPYLPSLIPGLQNSLLDPVPEVRAVSAKALGTMVKGMGEPGFEQLLPWLIAKLTSEQSSVDRSGAAQGYSEVLGAMGLPQLQKMMPDILSNAERIDAPPHVRDGYITMFHYLPNIFTDDFIPYIGSILPPILQALADENEFLRDTALQAGQKIINVYSDTSIELLLPELEKGLFADSWRIRHSSVKLLGDLLYKVSGVTGKMSTVGVGDDDNFGTETSQRAVFEAFGEERRNRVLAGLYMGRSDTAILVRQAALHVWKVVVTHTPKTLREILPTLFQLLLGCLASSSYDKRQVAAKTLGEVVGKLGEKVLPELIPILEKGLNSDQSEQRQGVCVALSEIIESTSREQIINYADSLIPTIRRALYDELPEVRVAAARAFDHMHNTIGVRTLEEILPVLLKKLVDPMQAEVALDGLKQVMAIKSRVVLPFLVPQLVAHPVNTKALSLLSSVAGDSLTRHLPKIMPALLHELSCKMDTEEEELELENCQTVVLSITNQKGLHVVVDELLKATKQKKISLAALSILQVFCTQSKSDLKDFLNSFIRAFILLMSHQGPPKLLELAWQCLEAIIKRLEGDQLMACVPEVRLAVGFAVEDCVTTELPGFSLPKKGISSVLPIFRECLLCGQPEMKEVAALGLSELITVTSAEALKVSVIHMTGPLIRILGDRYSQQVKVAVLNTLAALLSKCGPSLKAFLPQLQTTFLKALHDPVRLVRLSAARALACLMPIHMRLDPLFMELCNGIRNAEDIGTRDTFIQALRGCLVSSGNKMSEGTKQELQRIIEEFIKSCTDDSSRVGAAACLGVMVQHVADDNVKSFVELHMHDNDPTQPWTIRQARAVCTGIALMTHFKNLQPHLDCIVVAIKSFAASDRVPLALYGLRAAAFCLMFQLELKIPLHHDLLSVIAKALKHESNDIKSITSVICAHLGKLKIDDVQRKCLIAPLVNGVKEKNSIVRSNAELGLASILQLQGGLKTMEKISALLSDGMKESLDDVIAKNLKKFLSQPLPNIPPLDDTIIMQ